MKRIIYISITTLIVLSSCKKSFLEKPQGSDMNEDVIFSTKQKSLAAIVQAYSMSLASGISLSSWDGNRVYGLKGSTISELSGEINVVKYNWNDGWKIQRSGMVADDGGLARSSDGFVFNYTSIRQNYLIMENIDKVVDMTTAEKEQVKAEMKILTAYRYEEMFKRYGGVPLVEKTLLVTDDIKIPRASLEETLNYIIKLCDEAAAVLPDSYGRESTGRVTKGIALAIKAEALIFAARPLFNSVAPYMNLTGGTKLICFGAVDINRWQKAIDAAKATIDWSLANGYHIINTGSPLDDFGTAVATPSNPEILLADKNLSGGYYSPHDQAGGSNGMGFTQLSQYVKADGTEQVWAGSTAAPYSEYALKMNEMEPRYKASAMAAGIDAWNNPNDYYWSSDAVSNSSNWEGSAGTEACGRRAKFWYHAGTRTWFEFPVYRLAEFYLDLAEAYNELGDPSHSLQYLNVIRQRAGLPNVTETGTALLRKIIQREWAVEFYEEGHRLFDVKHWKLADLGNGIIGGDKKGFKFTYKNGSSGRVAADYLTYSNQVMYTGFWTSSQFLEPFPIMEVNKGYLLQNPGY